MEKEPDSGGRRVNVVKTIPQIRNWVWYHQQLLRSSESGMSSSQRRAFLETFGAGKRRPAYRSFEQARIFAQSLGLKTRKEWNEYCISGKKPEDIPSSPEIYREWAGIGNWLNTGRLRPGREFLPFEEARAFVLTLGLKTGKDWEKYSQSCKRPADIPQYPQDIYKNKGWVCLNHWLRDSHQASSRFRSFGEARAFVQTLGLRNHEEWRKYARSEQKPSDIPGDPADTYRDQGWTNWFDWLGKEGFYRVLAPAGGWRPFAEAQTFTQSLGLKSQDEWNKYANSGRKPEDIPFDPTRAYKEWRSWFDWLGKRGPYRQRKGGYKPYARHCDFCGNFYEGAGDRFCGRSCAGKWTRANTPTHKRNQSGRFI
jgi:hypothetical protein